MKKLLYSLFVVCMLSFTVAPVAHAEMKEYSLFTFTVPNNWTWEEQAVPPLMTILVMNAEETAAKTLHVYENPEESEEMLVNYMAQSVGAEKPVNHGTYWTFSLTEGENTMECRTVPIKKAFLIECSFGDMELANQATIKIK